MKSLLKSLTLNPKEDRRLVRGHLWAYRNEFKHLPEEMADGEAVDVFSDGRRFVGRGFYQSQGGIAVRIVTRHQEELDAEFFLCPFCLGADAPRAPLSRILRVPLDLWRE